MKSDEITQKEFLELSGVCDHKEDWICSKTRFARRDNLCPIVINAIDIEELRKVFINQDGGYV